MNKSKSMTVRKGSTQAKAMQHKRTQAPTSTPDRKYIVAADSTRSAIDTSPHTSRFLTERDADGEMARGKKNGRQLENPDLFLGVPLFYFTVPVRTI